MAKIKKIGILSLAKIQALIMAFFGLIIGLFFGLFGSVAMMMESPASQMAGLGLAAIIFVPFIYGIMGFVVGLITAVIYNLVAGWVGGLEIELENSEAPNEKKKR